MLNIIIISISLAMDCFAVSMAGGAVTKKPRAIDALKVGLFFGLFQALMPVIGWYIGFGFKGLIENVDHWIAFALLGLIGIKMIYESFKIESEKNRIDLIKMTSLLILSVATSIDALVIGITLSILGISLYLSVIIIGLFAFAFSFFGYFLGNKLGKFLESKVELIGGIVLVGIGIKILIEHLI
jgi:manganese efflux pump family protein